MKLTNYIVIINNQTAIIKSKPQDPIYSHSIGSTFYKVEQRFGEEERRGDSPLTDELASAFSALEEGDKLASHFTSLVRARLYTSRSVL